MTEIGCSLTSSIKTSRPPLTIFRFPFFSAGRASQQSHPAEGISELICNECWRPRSRAAAVGKTATNLADHELALAHKIDLLVIFPSSAGSIAELGMFCLEDTIAQKMAIFLSRRFRRSRSFVVNGPVAAAKRRNSKIFYVDYSDRDKIWKEVRSLVLDIRANKGRARLLKA